MSVIFKIEDNIPLPPTEEILPEEEPSRWVPFKPHQPKCWAGDHVPMIGRCTKCDDVFPCPSGNCGHFDCADPASFGYDTSSNLTETPDHVLMSESVVVRSRSGGTSLPEEGSDRDQLLD